MDKISARKRGLDCRNALSVNERREKDEVIFQTIKPYLDNAHFVGTYVSFQNEVNTHPIIQYCFDNDIPIAVPKTHKDHLTFHQIHSFNDLEEGIWSILEPKENEPIDSNQIDLMLVPLAAYDQNNNRCGYGKGYYDRILKEKMLKIGLAYREQCVESIDADEWDVPLDEIISA